MHTKTNVGVVMENLEVLFFDVLGTVVDWRGSIAAEVKPFLARYAAAEIDAEDFADAWVGRYDASVEAVRAGNRPFVTLDLLNLENLKETLEAFGLTRVKIDQADLRHLNLAWHRLQPWPDSAAGISRLKKHFIVAPLSDGHTRLMINVARHGKLLWDTVLGADVWHSYKPMPQVYVRACELLGVAPGNAMLIAAHDYDLNAARNCGLKTGYVTRPHANDPSKPAYSPLPNNWDCEASDLLGIADILLKGRS